MFSRFIHAVACVRISPFFLVWIIFIVCIHIFCLSIHLRVGNGEQYCSEKPYGFYTAADVQCFGNGISILSVWQKWNFLEGNTMLQHVSTSTAPSTVLETHEALCHLAWLLGFPLSLSLVVTLVLSLYSSNAPSWGLFGLRAFAKLLLFL